MNEQEKKQRDEFNQKPLDKFLFLKEDTPDDEQLKDETEDTPLKDRKLVVYQVARRRSTFQEMVTMRQYEINQAENARKEIERLKKDVRAHLVLAKKWEEEIDECIAQIPELRDSLGTISPIQLEDLDSPHPDAEDFGGEDDE